MWQASALSRKPAILGKQGAVWAGGSRGVCRGVPSGRGWSRQWSCGFTSLSHTGRGIYFSQLVSFVTSHLSLGEVSSPPPPPNLAVLPVPKFRWNPSFLLPMTPVQFTNCTALLQERGWCGKWKSVWGHFLCGAFGCSGSSPDRSWTCSSPSLSRRTGTMPSPFQRAALLRFLTSHILGPLSSCVCEPLSL